jgi:crossover junction endodeoxyribonuclease RusA
VTWQVTFVQPAVRLSLNDRVHWRVRARITRAWRHAAGYAALDQLGRTPSGRRRPPCTVRVAFPARDPGRRRDPHNMAPTVKAIVDGLVDAGAWPDDTNRFVVVLDPEFVRAAQVVVTLSPLPDGIVP